jgi:protein disulfide-isomerase A1
MKVVILFALLSICAHAHGDHDHDHSHGDVEHVLTLTNSNFEETIAKNELVLVEFFAPWCGHCKRLAPEYEAAASELYGQVPLAKVDCTVEKELCEKYEVQGFPTIKLFKKNGAVSDYDKGRTAADIVKFLKKQSQPALTVVTSEEQLTALKGVDDVVVVGYFTEGSDGAKVLKDVADTLRDDATFGIVNDAALSGSHRNSVVMFRKFDDPELTHKGDNTKEALMTFIKSESFPLVGEIGPENYQKYVERDLPLFWLFVDYNSDEVTKPLLEAATNVAKTVKGKMSFVKLDGNRWSSHAKNFGLSGNTPGLVIEDRTKRTKFVYPEADPVTLESLSRFVKSWEDGTLAPTLKSAEPPAENNAPVKVVVGKTFKDIVLDTSKDVFVEFYAPWCGHCKNLAPKWDALGEEFKDNDSIVIAKVDATENDTPADIQGFPTLIFYPANNKEGIVYRGERTKEALSDYVRQNSATLSKEGGGRPVHDDL